MPVKDSAAATTIKYLRAVAQDVELDTSQRIEEKTTTMPALEIAINRMASCGCKRAAREVLVVTNATIAARRPTRVSMELRVSDNSTCALSDPSLRLRNSAALRSYRWRKRRSV